MYSLHMEEVYKVLIEDGTCIHIELAMGASEYQCTVACSVRVLIGKSASLEKECLLWIVMLNARESINWMITIRIINWLHLKRVIHQTSPVFWLSH